MKEMVCQALREEFFDILRWNGGKSVCLVGCNVFRGFAGGSRTISITPVVIHDGIGAVDPALGLVG